MDFPVALTIKKAAARYSVSTRTVNRLIAAGRVEVRKMGRRTLVGTASLDAVFGFTVPTSLPTYQGDIPGRNGALPVKRKYQRSSKFRKLPATGCAR